MKQVTMMMMAAVLFVGLGQTAFVQAAEGDTGTGIGYVIKKMTGQLVMEEFPEDSEDVVEVTYAINDKTRFSNFESLDDLNEFDDLEIEYQEVNGQRLALKIVRVQVFQDFSGDEEYGGDTAEIQYSNSEDI